MTSTLSPYDTGDIRLGEGTRDLTYLTRPPVLRRPDATGEYPIYRPTGVDELARLSVGETMVLDVGVTPAEQPEPPVRPVVATVYAPAHATPEPVRPRRYRGRRRMPSPPAPRWATFAVTYGSGVISGALAVFLGALAVAL